MRSVNTVTLDVVGTLSVVTVMGSDYPSSKKVRRRSH